MNLYIAMSSAYMVMLVWVAELATWSMYIRNNYGPNTNPFGHLTQQEVCSMWCHPGPLPGTSLTNSHVSILAERGDMETRKFVK